MKFIIDHTQPITLQELQAFLHNRTATVELSAVSRKAIVDCRNYLDEKLQRINRPVYGINTGFGSLCNVIIPPSQIEQLQENLVKSHACGMGEEVPTEIVRLMLYLKVRSLSYGKSAVQLTTVERLIDFINRDILPVVYTQGSLGASGDLAPLAHLCLPLLGMGEVWYQGKKSDAASVLTACQLTAVKLASKEGLALLNGTQFMSAYAAWCCIQAQSLTGWAEAIAAVSADGFDARPDPFVDHLHTIRPHPGQLAAARSMRGWLDGSELIQRDKAHVQDPYSFRCIPQVHGASRDTLAHVIRVVETEINSVTDNPTVFPEEDEVLSGGNFHGQHLALVLDFLAIAQAELANISERRTYLLISGQRGLPPFLTAEAGLNSGFMIPQYTAASIVSQNKQLCTPASVDSIVSSNGQEDHVSMGANAATKCYKVIQNVARVLGIELLNAAQALEFRRPLKSSPRLEQLHAAFRERVPFMQEDQYLSGMMHAAEAFVMSHDSSVY